MLVLVDGRIQARTSGLIRGDGLRSFLNRWGFRPEQPDADNEPHGDDDDFNPWRNPRRWNRGPIRDHIDQAKTNFARWLLREWLGFAAGGIAGSRSSETEELRKESRSHTEASIAILLYHQLHEAGGYIVRPSTSSMLESLEPGTLIEIAGTVEKNAVDTVIDCMDALANIVKLDTSQPQQGKGKNRKPSVEAEIERIRDALDADRRRTPISNIVLRCSEPTPLNVIATLRRENLRDLTLSELNKNSVRVVGKVTRQVPEGESISSFENYGLALLKDELLQEVFGEIRGQEELVAEFSDVRIEGPVIQIIPLMVFV